MIGIIGAMDEEISEILKLFTSYETLNISNVVFYKGSISKKEVVLLKSGVGTVNAAIRTTILFENFDIDLVINIGSAGSISKDLDILNVIVSNRIGFHDFDNVSVGYKLGYDEDRTSFKSEEKYLDVVRKIDKNIIIGDMVSGDSFVNSKNKIDSILKYFPSAMACDMEGASVAAVSANYKKPFIILRAISDSPLRGNNEVDFEKYLVSASKNSAEFCKKFIENLN